MFRMWLYGGIALVIVFLGITAAIVMRDSPPATDATWQSGGGLFGTGDRLPLVSPQQNAQPGGGRDTLGAVPLPQPQAQGSDVVENFATDLAGLLAQLVRPPQSTREDTDPETPSSYAFIPQGLIATDVQQPLTPQQQALQDYGNTVGALLTAFADAHPDTPQILKDQAEDRGDALKAAALRQLGNDFVDLGKKIAVVGTVPASAANVNSALAAAYQEAGTKLADIAGKTADTPFLEAVYAYNTSAENLSKRVVAIVDLFASNEVPFSQSDAGSIFTFSQSSSF